MWSICSFVSLSRGTANMNRGRSGPSSTICSCGVVTVVGSAPKFRRSTAVPAGGPYWRIPRHGIQVPLRVAFQTTLVAVAPRQSRPLCQFVEGLRPAPLHIIDLVDRRLATSASGPRGTRGGRAPRRSRMELSILSAKVRSPPPSSCFSQFRNLAVEQRVQHALPPCRSLFLF